MYAIAWKRSAKRELRNIDRQYHPRILEGIESLAEDPRPEDSKKLTGLDDTYRIRIGQYRACYTVDDDTIVIEIIRVGHRQGVYQNLG